MIPNATAFRGSLGAILLPTVAAMFTLSVFAETFTEGKQVPWTEEKLKAGDFVWEPERAPEGPVLIVVSKPEQTAYVCAAMFARAVAGQSPRDHYRNHYALGSTWIYRTGCLG